MLQLKAKTDDTLF